MRYDIPAARHRTEIVIQRSRFICTIEHAPTVDAAQQFVRAVGSEMPDATHHCWAYVIGAPASTDRIGLSDDGEPHGTAGRPMLTVLTHSGVGDVVAVVTRYYGGTQLGTGGLVKAYGGAVSDALQMLPRAPRIDYTRVDISVAYGHVGAMQQLWPRFEIEVVNDAYATDATFRVRIPDERLDDALSAINDATGGTAQITRHDDA